MENVYDKILKDQGLEYEDLNPAEREIYNKANFDTRSLSVGDIKNHIAYMKNSVAIQLCNTVEGDPANPVLKGRLKNYIVLETFLVSPEKAQEAFKKQVEKKGTE